MAHPLRWSTKLATAAAIVVGLIACSTDSETAVTPEGGFCTALTGAYGRCAGASSCADSLGADCTKLAALLNPSVLTEATSCIQASTCGSDPLACVGKSLTALTPSAAQTKLATDFCESCASVGGDACQTAFFGSGKVPGLGVALLPFGDSPVAAIGEACTSNALGKVACQAAFSSCVGLNASKALSQTITVDSAKCLLTGIKDGLAGGGGGGGDGGGGGEGCTDCAGCCQDGVCQPGTDVAACGAAGGSCEACASGASCTENKCVTPCGSDNCTGCCDSGGTCQTTAGDASACGANGAACAVCTGTKSKCESGQCIDPGCKASCATGCCTAAGCQPGGLVAACGTGGNACVDCGAGRTCGAGVCALEVAAKWDFVLVGATLPNANGSGGSWDGFSGLPDVYATATSGAATGATTFVADTLTPVWNTPVLLGLTATQLKTEVKLDLSDDDVAFDDHVGLCTVKLVDADFDGTLRTATCPKAGTDVAFTVRYRLAKK